MFSLLLTLLDRFFFTGLSLSGESGFPRPLSLEEEKAALDALSKGDQTARSKLILHNLRLVAHVAKKYYPGTGDNEDLISIGTIGLIKAVDSYRPEKNIRLATFAARCIENELFMHFRSARRHNNEISLQEAVETDKDGNTLEILDTLSYDENLPELLGLREQIGQLEHELDRVLTGREKYIILRRYGLRGYTPMAQREIAALLGISRSYVSRIEKGALDKLRRALS